MDTACKQCEFLEECNVYPKGKLHALRPSNNNSPCPPKTILNKQRETESQYKILFESSPDAIFIADAESGVILDANKRAADLLGIPVEQIIGMHQSQLHPAEKADQYEKYQKHLKKEKTIASDTLYVCHKDGRKIPVQIHASITQIGNKKVIHGVFRDITEQTEHEKKGPVTREKFRLLMQGIVDPAGILDTEGYYVFMNDEGLRRLGLTLDEAVGKHIREIFGEQVDKTHSPALQKVLKTQTSQAITEQICAQGQYRWYQTRLHPIKNSDGQIVNILGISHDIHEEMMLKKKVEESERKYRQLYQNANVALFRSSLDGTLLDCNKACLALLGHRTDEHRDDYVNKICVTDYYVDTTRRQQFIETLMRNKRVQCFEAELKRADSTTFWASLSADISPEAGYVEGSIQDVTLAKVLSPTEQKVLAHLLEGKSNKQIARDLGRSVRTIEDHRARIMQKVDVDNLVDLTRKTLKCGIVTLGK